MPCKDLRLAVWFPLDVLIPEKSISVPDALLIIASFVIWKSCSISQILNFSTNSGMMDLLALVIVYLVNRILWSGS